MDYKSIEHDLYWGNLMPMLIVKDEHGLIYTNQVGGIYCEHPVVTGYLIPLPDKWRGCLLNVCANCSGINKITENYEDMVQEDLNYINLTLDKSEENLEAWIHLIDSDGTKFVLTWENSD